MRLTLKRTENSDAIQHLSHELSIDPTLAKLLVQRGVHTFDEAKKFFRPTLNYLHDPFLMKDMDNAVQRIKSAINANESILVYGDYDVDGTTSVALMVSYLKTITQHVTAYIPDRYKEGYGVSFQGIDYAKEQNITLIITLDCGIKAIDKIDYAKDKGIDVIICDHHRPGDMIPQAVAVLDPKQYDCQYPYKELCGCGVGFKLIQALTISYNKSIQTILPYLDLVATAIAADIVPITGENRVLAYFGLQIINSNPRTGFKAMLAHAKKNTFTITDLVFVIAPRINAAGRMKHGMYAVRLLIEKNYEKAVKYASEIENYNTNRKETDQQITAEALAQIVYNKEQNRFSTVVYNEGWNKGVIGIVASRLIETYYRPTLVFTKSGDKLAASARSVKGFDIYNALESCAEHLEQFGGHKYAAGLTMLEKNYIKFKEQFEHVVATTIKPEVLTPEISVDANLEFNQITPKFYRILKQFAPFGPGNMMPVFMTEGLKDTGFAKCVGNNQKHLKCSLQKNNISFQAIGFNLGSKHKNIDNQKICKAIYNLDENEWNNQITLQLNLKDII